MIRESLKKFVLDESSFNTELAMVKSVNHETSTCVLELIGEGIVLEDIDMKIGEDNKGLVLIPKVGSIVMVEVDLGAVLMFSELDTMICKIEDATMDIDKESQSFIVGDTKMTISKDGFLIEKGGVSLFTIFEDLLKAIKTLTVPTPAGPSGVPTNAAIFEQIKLKANQILK